MGLFDIFKNAPAQDGQHKGFAQLDYKQSDFTSERIFRDNIEREAIRLFQCWVSKIPTVNHPDQLYGGQKELSSKHAEVFPHSFAHYVELKFAELKDQFEKEQAEDQKFHQEASTIRGQWGSIKMRREWNVEGNFGPVHGLLELTLKLGDTGPSIEGFVNGVHVFNLTFKQCKYKTKKEFILATVEHFETTLKDNDWTKLFGLKDALSNGFEVVDPFESFNL